MTRRNGHPPPTLNRRACLAAAAAATAMGVLAGGGATVRADDSITRRPWPAKLKTPALDAPCFEGPEVHLAALRGQVVLLNFWASWCPGCRDEMPSLELLATRFGGEGLAVVAVNYRETDGAIRRFTEQLVGDLRIARDADGAVARAWGVRVFPTTVAVGRDGRAAFSVVGAVDWMADPVRGWVAELLAQRPAA
ncbi:MAG: TlpA family protein disulfide reductase [Pelomonas sp.]|nr:TlpA family protein disulfide reductase [Roseateles sp.]